MKKMISVICALAVLFGIPVFTWAEGESITGIQIQATSYDTDGILIPSYTYNGSETEASQYRWLEADTLDAPEAGWRQISYDNTAITASGAISAENAENAYLLLSQKQTGKFVKLEITNGGQTFVSTPTPRIAFTANLANNGAFNPAGIKAVDGENKNGGEILGWKYAVYQNYATETYGRPAKVDMARVDYKNYPEAANWFSRIDMPQKLTMNQYRIQATVYQQGTKLDVFSRLSGLSPGGQGSANWPEEKFTNYDKIVNSSLTSKAADAWLSFQFRGGLTYGNYDICNISLTAVAPVARDPRIEGEAKAGGTVTAAYDYDNTYDAADKAEGISAFRWLYADNPYGPWTAIDGAVAGTLTIPSEAAGKYLRVEVTPVNADGVAGYPIQSTAEVKVLAGAPVTVLAVDDDYRTNGILIPSYRFDYGTEGISAYRWLMADSPDAPAGEWEEIAYDNQNISAKGEITADTAKEAYLLLSQKQAGKYIKFEVTPQGEDGTLYPPMTSEATPVIAYTPNLINNGAFSPAGARADGSFYGWTDIAYTAKYSNGGSPGAGKVSKRENNTWYANLQLPVSLAPGAYVVEGDILKETGGALNWRVCLNDTDSGNKNSANVDDGFLSTANVWKSTDRLILITPEKAALSPSISFRSCTKADAGATVFHMDNVSMVHYAPVAADVRIDGAAVTGGALTGSYTYSSEKDFPHATENGTVFQWYVSETQNGPWTAAADGNERTIILDDSMAGKYICLEVTPKNSIGAFGTPVRSDAVQVAQGVVINHAGIGGPIVPDSQLTADVQITNNTGADIYPAVVLAVYNASGALVNVGTISDRRIGPGTSETFAPVIMLSSDTTAASARLMVFESLATLRPLLLETIDQ